MTGRRFALVVLLSGGAWVHGCTATALQPATPVAAEHPVTTSRTLVCQDPRLGEVTDFRLSPNAENTNDIQVLGSKGVLTLRANVIGGYDVVQFCRIERPSDIHGFGNHVFQDIDGDGVPEILQSGNPDDAWKVAAYSLDGKLRWVVDPQFPIKSGWANQIQRVLIMNNSATGEHRILVLSFSNTMATLVSSNGKILAQPVVGRVNSGASAEWRSTGTSWTGCIFGSGDKVVGIDGEGAVLISKPLTRNEKYVSTIDPLRSSGARDEFLVLGILGNSNEYVDTLIRPESGDLNAVVVQTDDVWARTARVPLHAAQGDTQYWAQRAAVSSQASPVGISGRVLRLTLWGQDGRKACAEEFASKQGGGRFGQVLGDGAIASFSQQSTNDTLLVGWGDCVWFVRLNYEPK